MWRQAPLQPEISGAQRPSGPKVQHLDFRFCFKSLIIHTYQVQLCLFAKGYVMEIRHCLTDDLAYGRHEAMSDTGPETS